MESLAENIFHYSKITYRALYIYFKS